jgi:hypothetical protein
MPRPFFDLAAPFVVGAALLACGSTSPVASTDDDPGETPVPPVVGSTVPTFYSSKFSNVVSMSVEGDYVVITTRNLPDHKSPYYAVGSANYEAYNGANPNFRINPNRIIEQQLTFRIPITPTTQTTPSPTPLGAMGISVNGLALYNQYAGPNQPLTSEIDSFDQYDGHPQASGQYHYHLEPSWVTRASREALVGVLLDGYPVYGPMEGGRLVASSELDAAHGHTTATADFPNGIYHYHTTNDAPYINGSGFRGTPGTVGR